MKQNGMDEFFYRYLPKNNINVIKENSNDFLDILEKINKIESHNELNGKKESNNKQEFELDWEFIESMAKRMAKNKSKYGKDNWKKPMDLEQLKQALFRHVLQVMKGNYNDEDKLDHLDAIAINAMFIKYQLKHHGLHNK